MKRKKGNVSGKMDVQDIIIFFEHHMAQPGRDKNHPFRSGLINIMQINKETILKTP